MKHPSESSNSSAPSFQSALQIHLLKYLGVGLLSGSLVHAATLGGSTFKYVFFIILGVISIVFGHILELRQKNAAIKLNWILLAIILAFGTGMLGGSIQHYFDSPHIASFLFAGGFFLTFIALLLQNHRAEFSVKKIMICLLISALSYIFLSRVTPHFIPESFIGGGHSHGASDHHQASEIQTQQNNDDPPSDDIIEKAMEPETTEPIMHSEPKSESHDNHDHSQHKH